jgi:hypothetical protein
VLADQPDRPDLGVLVELARHRAIVPSKGSAHETRDGSRTLLSSGCHVTELREGAWTLAQNFGRTVGVVSDGS